MIKVITLCFLCITILSCREEVKTKQVVKNTTQELIILKDTIKKTDYKILFKNNPEYVSNGFDFPVGKPDAKNYYNAQKFQENNHLGDDWNGVGGGNSDLGDAIYAIGNGYISEVKDYSGGWGNVLRIVHLKNNTLYESLYAHCDTILVSENQFIKKGDKIATIGNNSGQYWAHLHLEVRDSVNLDIGPGYSNDISGYLDPTQFIKKNRK